MVMLHTVNEVQLLFLYYIYLKFTGIWCPFAVCNESERQLLHSHLTELRIKQMVAHAINQLQSLGTGWKCVPVIDSASLLSETQVRPNLLQNLLCCLYYFFSPVSHFFVYEICERVNCMHVMHAKLHNSSYL